MDNMSSKHLIRVYNPDTKRMGDVPPHYLDLPIGKHLVRVEDGENCVPCREAQEAELAAATPEPVEVAVTEEAPKPRGRRITEPAIDPSGDN